MSALEAQQAADARTALLTLALAVEPADPGVGRLVEQVGPVAALARLRSGTSGLRHEEGIRRRLSRADLERELTRCRELGVRIVTRVDGDWPTQLDDLRSLAPFALWVLGAADVRLALLRSVAVVGARACSAYGEEVARAWSAELGEAGWSVVSGGAFGIDAASHRGALAVEATTVCMVAGGVDIPYPRAHDALLARIADEGLVVSESPLGEQVRRQRFLSRNRLIAASTRATIVVEAAERSGTMATATSAGRMNRLVLAVPGPVSSPASAGCHRMIKDGTALLVDSPAEVLHLLDPGSASPMQPGVGRERDALRPREQRALDALPARGTLDVDEWATRAGMSVEELLASAGLLEAMGWVVQGDSGWRLLRR